MKKIIFCSAFLFAFLCSNAQKKAPKKNKNTAALINTYQTGNQGQSADWGQYIQKTKETRNRKNRSGNHNIQDLMSEYNQAENLAGNVSKKKKDSKKAIRSRF